MNEPIRVPVLQEHKGLFYLKCDGCGEMYHSRVKSCAYRNECPKCFAISRAKNA